MFMPPLFCCGHQDSRDGMTQTRGLGCFTTGYDLLMRFFIDHFQSKGLHDDNVDDDDNDNNDDNFTDDDDDDDDNDDDDNNDDDNNDDDDDNE